MRSRDLRSALLANVLTAWDITLSSILQLMLQNTFTVWDVNYIFHYLACATGILPWEQKGNLIFIY